MAWTTEKRPALAPIDLVLAAMAILFPTVGAILLWFSPRCWADYLFILDVRYWPPWKAIGLFVVVTQSLMVIRYWPEKKYQNKELLDWLLAQRRK